jgi:adenylate cyclase
LVNYFTELHEQVWHASSPPNAHEILKQHEPELVVVDLHMLKDGWAELVHRVQHEAPETKLLLTTSYPDPQQESLAKNEFGTRVILRPPFTRAGLEQALRDLEGDRPIMGEAKSQANLPKVRVPVRIKITFPYVVLALLLALAAAYVVSQVVLDTIEERFTNQLIEAGKLASDWLVNEEDRLLETLRLVAHTQGLPEAIAGQDAEQLRQIVLPLAINYQEEAVEILDAQGTSLLSLRRGPSGSMEDYEANRGETIFGQWEFVRNVLQQRADQGRDKYAGLVRAPWGDYLYVSGPILDDQGKRVGVILVGKSLPTLVRQIRQDTLAHITIYDLNGQPIESTLTSFSGEVVTLAPETAADVLENQDDTSLIRPLQIASIDYSEIVGPLESREYINSASARNNNDEGLLGVTMAETFLARPGQITRLQIFALTAVAFILVITLGIWLANRLTRPLLRVVAASAEVAQGNLDVQVESRGDDEIAVLAHSFNEMVSSLREGSMYRDLLGRTVSPAVREQLRQGFATGDLSLEGKEAVAAVLVSDIRGFTTLAESENPTTVMNWLNEYFEELIPIITDNGGVVSKFEGDAVLAFYGILPRSLPAQESAFRACQTALAMLEAIERLNARRRSRGEPTFAVGIGINSGPVTAGALGSMDRLQYTVIGDTVNTTERLVDLSRQFGEQNSTVISQHTLFALRERREEFELESLGVHHVKGKVEQLLVYRLQPAKMAV